MLSFCHLELQIVKIWKRLPWKCENVKKVDDGVKQSCVKEEEPSAEKKTTLFAVFLAAYE